MNHIIRKRSLVCSSQKHTDKILTLENPLLYSKTGVYGEAVLTSTHNLYFEQKYEKYQIFFLSENFQFLVVKFSIYLKSMFS